MKDTILAINPGSTSTKIAVYDGQVLRFEQNIHHSNEELAAFASVVDQFDYRKGAVLAELQSHGVAVGDLAAVVGRGGLIHPIESGTYTVNEAMIADLNHSPVGHHASNLGGLIARQIADAAGVEAYVADPVVVDEMDDVARVAGHPDFARKSIFHALNQKAVARLYAAQIGQPYEELNLVIAHLGGGISVGAHRKGRVVDVNNTLDGEGPMTPERAGTLPVGDLVKCCFSGQYSQKEIGVMVKGKGGLVAHLGTNDTLEVLDRIKKGDTKAELVLDALCYQTAKYIGEMAVALEGEVDAILITGGMAYSEWISGRISRRVAFIAPVQIFAGQDEMHALAASALAVLSGEREAKIYRP